MTRTKRNTVTETHNFDNQLMESGRPYLCKEQYPTFKRRRLPQWLADRFRDCLTGRGVEAPKETEALIREVERVFFPHAPFGFAYAGSIQLQDEPFRTGVFASLCLEGNNGFDFQTVLGLPFQPIFQSECSPRVSALFLGEEPEVPPMRAWLKKEEEYPEPYKELPTLNRRHLPQWLAERMRGFLLAHGLMTMGGTEELIRTIEDIFCPSVPYGFAYAGSIFLEDKPLQEAVLTPSSVIGGGLRLITEKLHLDYQEKRNGNLTTHFVLSPKRGIPSFDDPTVGR